MKEIELLLMSTEDELRGQPSLPVSRFCGLEGQWFRPNPNPVNKEEETSGGSVSAKMMKQDHIAIFVRVHDPLCNPLLFSSVTIDIKVPFLLLFFP